VRVLVLIVALGLDRFLGEYPNRWHPVVWMGKVIQFLERRAPSAPGAQLAYGLGMAFGVPALFATLGAVLLVPGLDFVAGVFLVKACFAMRALGQAGDRVATAVDAGDLAAAREGLRSLCSRDPSSLSAQEVVAGATESVAENASDSIVAPLFWYALFGLPGILYYRAANTMDAMIGYHGRYEWLGKAAARQDDVLNVVPARLTALLLLVGGGVLGSDVPGGLRILRRDAGKTESPNAGWPMATMAGLLGVVLEKSGHYRLGDGGGRLDGGTIRRAWRIVQVGVAIGVLVGVGIGLALT
jgi:adenosylcobinamide-phosphate synthase